MLTADYLAGAQFCLVAQLAPELDASGAPIEDNPQRDLQPGEAHPKLEPPFCRIALSEVLTDDPGVYIIRVAEQVVYVGKAKNLRQRWGGYRSISAANCRRNGQATNCRINSRVLQAWREHRTVDLWFRRDVTLEDRMIAALKPPWN